MKKHSIFLFLLLSAILPFFAFAQTQGEPDPFQVNEIIFNIIDVVSWLVTIAFTLAVVVFGWGLVKLIYAGGDPKKIQRQKESSGGELSGCSFLPLFMELSLLLERILALVKEEALFCRQS